jgi:outer membrane biosynthesis protein TonB
MSVLSTAALHRRDPTIFWAIVVSILLHGIALVPGIRDLFPTEFLKIEEQPVVLEPIEFVLVSPANTPTPTDRASRYLSTTSSAASDNDDQNDDSALPKSDGVIPIPDTPSPEPGAEGGGETELPALPEETTDLGEAFKRSKFLKEMSPSRVPSLPEENPKFENVASASASVGGISINTTAWDFAPYLLDLKQRIKRHWIPPLAFTALGAIHGYTKINFRIYSDGRMEGLDVVESLGHKALHRSSKNAIKGAAPFRRLPDDFPEEYLDVTFGFYYLLPGDEREFFGKE